MKAIIFDIGGVLWSTYQICNLAELAAVATLTAILTPKSHPTSVQRLGDGRLTAANSIATLVDHLNMTPDYDMFYTAFLQSDEARRGRSAYAAELAKRPIHQSRHHQQYQPRPTPPGCMNTSRNSSSFTASS
ncbi:MAG: hypothetical protein M5U34_41085 [Chloroflexi bacterium]|nr:hypothetical protein [Chloroflexota bacterium]